jgi:hypothetical protein
MTDSVVASFKFCGNCLNWQLTFASTTRNNLSPCNSACNFHNSFAEAGLLFVRHAMSHSHRDSVALVPPGCILPADSSSATQEIPPPTILWNQSSSPCSQEPTTCLILILTSQSTHFHPVSVSYILILSSHLHLGQLSPPKHCIRFSPARALIWCCSVWSPEDPHYAVVIFSLLLLPPLRPNDLPQHPLLEHPKLMFVPYLVTPSFTPI